MSAARRALILAAMMTLGIAPFSHAGETRLIDQFGRPVGASSLSGRWLLVYFGYASCKEICPAALTAMTAVLARLGTVGDLIDPVFVTLDPAHDSPAVMRAYAAHFDPRLRALTGSDAAVADAARTFGVPWKHAAATGVIDHGTLFYLVDPDGHVVQMLHPQQPVADLAAAIRSRLPQPARVLTR
jgi:protein SCO1